MGGNTAVATLIAAAVVVAASLGTGVAQDTSVCYCPCMLFQCLSITSARMAACDQSCNFACWNAGLPVRFPDMVESCGIAPPPPLPFGF